MRCTSALRTAVERLIGVDDHHPASVCPSRPIGSVQRSRLLDVTEPIRSLMLDYADDSTAVACLSTCHFLHARYHQYPVKQAVPVDTLLELTSLRDYPRRVNLWPLTQVCLAVVVQLCFAGMFGAKYASSVTDALRVVLMLLPAIGTVRSGLDAGDWRPLPRLWPSSKCCASGGSAATRLRRHPLPRVQMIAGRLKDVELLPCLQHLTEVDVHGRPRSPLGKQYPLPPSLRTLHVYWVDPHEHIVVCLTSWLLCRLVSLRLWRKDETLPIGWLPPSLTSLHLEVESGTWPTGAVTLPLGLQTFRLDEWTLPLSHIALPASLTKLDIRRLSDHPLPVLPPQLEVLCIEGAFNQP